MAQATQMASRMFSMLPLAIPFVGILTPRGPAPEAEAVRFDLSGGPDRRPLQDRRDENSATTFEPTGAG